MGMNENGEANKSSDEKIIIIESDGTNKKPLQIKSNAKLSDQEQEKLQIIKDEIKAITGIAEGTVVAVTKETTGKEQMVMISGKGEINEMKEKINQVNASSQE